MLSDGARVLVPLESGSITALDPALRSILIDKAAPRKRRCGPWDEPPAPDVCAGLEALGTFSL
ncbi:protein of unknown function [Hyphomicrobium sp. MC1]|nr:protein of unknown function [Hyphomicrobium sp. MC1]